MRPRPIRLGDRRVSKGAAYLLALFAIACALAISAKVVELGALEDQKRAEQRLINVGLAYRTALESYARVTPAGQVTAPREVKQLLQDDRFPGVVRHLRVEYTDPMVPSGKMIPERDAQGLIQAFRSDSGALPVMQVDLKELGAGFSGAKSYREWLFTARTQIPGAGRVQP